MVAVRFVYGLSFFSLGLVVSLQPHWRSRYHLAKGLWALALFAFLHAFADWGLVFIPLRTQVEQSAAVAVLWGFRTMLGAASFGFLLHFGTTLLGSWLRGRAALAAKLLAPLISAVWMAAFFVYPLVHQHAGIGTWYLVSEVWSRYLLGLPAGLAVAVGLIAQRQELQRDHMQMYVRSLNFSALFFLLYGLTGGLVVPRQPFWPASLVNSENFLRYVGVPIEIIRTATAIGIAYYTASLVGIFAVETSRRLYRAEEERAILEDRGRIARDMHDGVLQTLYGVGLGIRSVKDRLPEDADTLGSDLEGLSRQLGEAVEDLRQSIMGLRERVIDIADLLTATQACVGQFAHLSDLSISLDTEGLDPPQDGRRIPASFRDHLLALVREGLSNAVRHSGADRVKILLALEEDTLILRIEDKGMGFDPAGSNPEVEAPPLDSPGGMRTHHGLRNMKSRTEQLGGAFRLDSAPGEGTRLLFQIPIPGPDPEGRAP